MSRQFSWGGSLVARLEFRRGCHLCPGGLPTLAWLHRKDLVKDGLRVVSLTASGAAPVLPVPEILISWGPHPAFVSTNRW